MRNIYHGLILIAFILLVGCNNSDDKRIKIGTISGPETELMEVAAKEMKERSGIELKIVEFSDYSLPNTALYDGAIDANMFQHLPYLQAENKARNYDLIPIGKTFIYPMGLYSKKITRLSEITKGNIVAIPNDPTNESRALLLLQQAGLIRLSSTDIAILTPNHIISNPKHLKFRELDAAQLPRTLEDVTLAAINTNYAIPAGMLPKRDALYVESKDSPYANIIVVKEKNKNDPRFKVLISALQSGPVQQRATELFKGQAIPAWAK